MQHVLDPETLDAIRYLRVQQHKQRIMRDTVVYSMEGFRNFGTVIETSPQPDNAQEVVDYAAAIATVESLKIYM